MPLNRAPLLVEANPRSVQEARRWVVQACRDLGRSDLVPCAELGVSELLTNALIHGQPPISVRVRGTRHHPRIEVADGSRRPPVLTRPSAHAETLLTVGRGTGIVAMSSVVWGAAIEATGKVVWFEPASEASGERWVEPRFTRDPLSRAAMRDPMTRVPVRLLGVPVGVFVDQLNLYCDLRRELRLLALAHGDDYPVARHLSEALTEFEREYPPGTRSQIDAALEAGEEYVDLELGVAPTAPPVYQKILGVLELADAFCRDERLLSLARTPAQVDFQQWYLGEFIRQVAGEAPRPWVNGSGEPDDTWLETEPSAS